MDWCGKWEYLAFMTLAHSVLVFFSLFLVKNFGHLLSVDLARGSTFVARSGECAALDCPKTELCTPKNQHGSLWRFGGAAV